MIYKAFAQRKLHPAMALSPLFRPFLQQPGGRHIIKSTLSDDKIDRTGLLIPQDLIAAEDVTYGKPGLAAGMRVLGAEKTHSQTTLPASACVVALTSVHVVEVHANLTARIRLAVDNT